MKAEIVLVTPQLAADWLAKNVSNRALRRSVVEGLKSAFLRGEYIQTHQGIAFAENGELLDGQHRLTAISELESGIYPMLVARGVANGAFRVMDIGVKRTAADALRSNDRRLVEVARLACSVAFGIKSGITPTMLMPFMEAIENPHGSLMAFCSTAAKTWGSAPVRLACCMLMIDGANPDYVRMLYRAMIMGDFDSMPKVAQSLYRASVEGRIRATDRLDMIARVLAAFDVRKAGNKNVQIRSTADIPEEVRRLFGHCLAEEVGKKKAPAKAPKGVVPGDSTPRLPGINIDLAHQKG